MGAFAIVGPAFLLGQCSGARIEADRQAKSEASAISQTAVGERVRDEAAVNQLEMNLSDAAKAFLVRAVCAVWFVTACSTPGAMRPSADDLWVEPKPVLTVAVFSSERAYKNYDAAMRRG